MIITHPEQLQFDFDAGRDHRAENLFPLSGIEEHLELNGRCKEKEIIHFCVTVHSNRLANTCKRNCEPLFVDIACLRFACLREGCNHVITPPSLL